MDEVATVVYSLGQGAGDLPLNQLLSLDQLLEPLKPLPDLGFSELVHSLLREAPHPPLYFILSHFWMKGFSLENGLVSVWATRTLPVLFGTLAIPASYGLGQLAFRSPVVGHFSALIMTFSPFGIAYAQETRHYSMVILMVILSLICLVLAARYLENHHPFPAWLSVSWIVINSLGVAVHLFFVLTLVAEALVLLLLGIRQNGRKRAAWFSPAWISLYAIAAGSALGTLMWVDFVVDRQRFVAQLTVPYFTGLYWINPLAQALAACISMVFWLPVEAPNHYLAIASGIMMLLLLIWLIPILWQGLRAQIKHLHVARESTLLLSFTVAAMLVFFFLSYAMAFDITRGFRYNFVYFPGVVTLMAAGLSEYWAYPLAFPRRCHPSSFWDPRHSRMIVIVVMLIACLSALTVVMDLGFRKFFRTDRFLAVVQQVSEAPVVLGSTVVRPDQIGVFGNDLMSLGWDIQRHEKEWMTPPHFFLVNVEGPQSTPRVLNQILPTLKRPTELWLLYFSDTITMILSENNCRPKLPYDRGNFGGFSFQHYCCQ
jgi:uncharacterized membrane protein